MQGKIKFTQEITAYFQKLPDFGKHHETGIFQLFLFTAGNIQLPFWSCRLALCKMPLQYRYAAPDQGQSGNKMHKGGVAGGKDCEADEERRFILFSYSCIEWL
jgi:hypothetical protein